MSGDPTLAKLMQDMRVKAPREKIVTVDWLATAMNREQLKIKDNERIVILECGHSAVTKNKSSCGCTECHQMIVSGEDYEAFRNRR